MKLAVTIIRSSEFRLLAPVIDRALQSGWAVECWHDYGHSRDGGKGYLFPSTDAVSQLRYGTPIVRTYRTSEELARLVDDSRADVVLSTGVPPWNERSAPARVPRWICLQSLIDTFLNHSPEALGRCDLLALMSPWWLEWAAAYYAAHGDAVDMEAARAVLRPRAAHIGFPELEARRLVEPDAVRRRWQIPPDQPVVLLLPFPQGAGHDSFWPKRVFGEASRAKRILNVALHRKFQYWQQAWNDVTDHSVVRATRTFCDRNGAFLLVKSRLKAPIPAYTTALADRCLYDETYYPPTIVEAMSIATVCISFFSASVLEAAAMSVPNICVTFTADDYLPAGAPSYISFQRFLTRTEGGLFQFKGVSTTVTIDEAIHELPRRTLDEFALDHAARLEYVRTFIGEDDGQASARLLQAAAGSVERPAIGARW